MPRRHRQVACCSADALASRCGGRCRLVEVADEQNRMPAPWRMLPRRCVRCGGRCRWVGVADGQTRTLAPRSMLQRRCARCGGRCRRVVASTSLTGIIAPQNAQRHSAGTFFFTISPIPKMPFFLVSVELRCCLSEKSYPY